MSGWRINKLMERFSAADKACTEMYVYDEFCYLLMSIKLGLKCFAISRA
jgi:hypothetical protein